MHEITVRAFIRHDGDAGVVEEALMDAIHIEIDGVPVVIVTDNSEERAMALMESLQDSRKG